MPCSISLMLTLTWGTDILFDKIRPETGGINLKNSLCTMPPSSGRDFMQSLSSFLIYLVVIRTLMAWLLVRLLGKIQFKRCCWCGDLTCTVSLSLGQVNRLGVKGNYVCCPVIVVIVMGLGGAKNYGRGGGLKSSYGGKLKEWATKSKAATVLCESWPLR